MLASVLDCEEVYSSGMHELRNLKGLCDGEALHVELCYFDGTLIWDSYGVHYL